MLEEPASTPARPRGPLTRVVFVAPFGLGRKTTVWARTLPLAQYLQRQGITVDLIIPPWDTPAHSGLSWSDRGVKLDNVRLQRGPAAILARMMKRVLRANPQIVHIVKPIAYAGAIQSTLWSMRKVGRFSGNIVLDVDDWEQAWAVLNQRPVWMRRLMTAQENWGLSHADGVTAASRWLEERAYAANPQRPICYLPNGVEIESGATQTLAAPAPAPSTPENPASANPASANPASAAESTSASLAPNATPQPRVLYFTRFMEIPPVWLVDFCTALFAQHPTATLSIAGSGIRAELEAEFKDKFLAQAKTAGFDLDRIEWHGHVARQALSALYATHQCAIFPAQPTALQQAKCSVRLANTLVHGLPVVASDVGEQSAYGEAGHAVLLPATTPAQDFAAAVNQLLCNPENARKAQIDARAQLLAQYSWDTLGQRLVEFYHRVLEA